MKSLREKLKEHQKEMKEHKSDPQKAMEILGWRAETKFEELVKKMVKSDLLG